LVVSSYVPNETRPLTSTTAQIDAAGTQEITGGALETPMNVLHADHFTPVKIAKLFVDVSSIPRQKFSEMQEMWVNPAPDVSVPWVHVVPPRVKYESPLSPVMQVVAFEHEIDMRMLEMLGSTVTGAPQEPFL